MFRRGQYTQGKRLQTDADGRATVTTTSAELKILWGSALGPDHRCTTTLKQKRRRKHRRGKLSNGSEQWLHLQVQEQSGRNKGTSQTVVIY